MDKDGSLTISFNEWRDFLLYAPSTDLLGLIEYWHHTNVSIDLHWKSLCIISLLFFYSFLIQVISIVNIISIELFYICRNIDCSSNANNSETVYYSIYLIVRWTRRVHACVACVRARIRIWENDRVESGLWFVDREGSTGGVTCDCHSKWPW